MITRSKWDALTPEEQWQYIVIMERSDQELRSLLSLIPECPEHGDQCIPHARTWVTEQPRKTERLLSFLRNVVAREDNRLKDTGYGTIEEIHKHDVSEAKYLLREMEKKA